MGKEDEQVLVIHREIVTPTPWEGIKVDGIAGFEDLIKANAEYRRRGDVEDDPNWKQLIPYMVFRYKDLYWAMQRTTKSGEDRLHNLYTLGIGGHVRKEDLEGEKIIDWANREFQEEVDYKGSFTSKPIGLLNAEKTPVDRVHIGYVILIEGDSYNIKSKEEEHQNAQLLTLPQMEGLYDQMEGWSKFVYKFLKEQNG